MKTILLTALAAMFASSVALANDDLIVNNKSVDATAVGKGGVTGSVTWFQTEGSFATDGKALAGSVYVDDCNCWDDVTVVNDSYDSLAVGNAAAGSVIVK